MRYFKGVGVIFSLLLWLACGPLGAQETPVGVSTKVVTSQQNTPPAAPSGSTELDLCPVADLIPAEVSIETKGQDPSKFVDKDRDLKNVATDIVVQKFFNNPDALFNFMKMAYGTLDSALANYREINDLSDRAIFLLFKGGNVLRIVANGLFNKLPPEQRDYLKQEYAPDFKRSDADFSVYIDETKIKNFDYDKVYNQVADVIYDALNKTRIEFQANPQKYFNLFRLKPEYAQQELAPFLEELNKISAVEDKDNEKWYQAKFKQIQLLDMQAAKAKLCDYKGQLDHKFVAEGSKIVGIPLTRNPSWIVNSDNRILEWPWGSDPKKLVKFALIRSKAAFAFTYDKDGKLLLVIIGGEVEDVSLTHRLDSRLRAFLDNYDQTVARYTLVSESLGEKFTMKAYSLMNLAEDLQFIIFDSFDRPWNGGLKYAKRVNRLFFLYIVEMLGTYGLGSKKSKEYIAEVKKKILDPLAKLYPVNSDSAEIAKKLVDNAKQLASDWPKLPRNNEFWQALGVLVSKRLIQDPLEGDAEGFKEFLEHINMNIDRITKLNSMPLVKVDPEDVYKTDMTMLF